MSASPRHRMVGPGLHPVTGSGVLSRHGALIVLCSLGEPSATVVDDILGAHAEVAHSGGDGTALADRLAALLVDAPDMSAVVFGPAGGAVIVAVFGHAWADVTTEHGEQRLALRQSRDGVRSVLPGTLLSIRAGLGEVDVDALPQQWGNLEHGSVHAAGMLYTAPGDVGGVAAEPAPAPSEAEPTAALPRSRPPDLPTAAPDGTPETSSVDRSQPFSSVVLVTEAGTAPQAQVGEPLPIVTRSPDPVAPEVASVAHPADAGSVEVLGVYCKNGHFDDPAARYCAICGISMAQLTLRPRPGPRPPLGVLVLDDGSVFSLDSDYVIGRDPFRDERVAAGVARPMRIDDSRNLISRAHTQIRLDGWLVQVVDLGSANGTGIRAPGETEWRPIAQLTPVTIRPGTQVGFGQRQLRYESHRNT